MLSFVIEALIEYGISVVIFLLRFFARWKVVGLRGFDVGDAFCLLALIFYSLETSGQYLLSVYPSNLFLTPATAPKVPPAEISEFVLGSKLAFINWIWYIHAIWALKGVLLSLYYRMGAGLWQQQRIVLGVSAFAGMAYIGSMLTHLCACVPVYKAWQIEPYPGDACTVRPQNHWVIGILNVLTDLMVLAIPMPLLFKVQIPLTRKLALAVLFGSGIFVIITTILRTYYSLLSINQLPIAMGWASREMFVGAIVVCLPGIKPLIRNLGWFGLSTRGKSGSGGQSGGANSGNGWMKRSGNSRTTDFGRVYYEMPSIRQENKNPNGSTGPDSDEEAMMGKHAPIQVKVDYGVSSTPAERF